MKLILAEVERRADETENAWQSSCPGQPFAYMTLEQFRERLLSFRDAKAKLRRPKRNGKHPDRSATPPARSMKPPAFTIARKWWRMYARARDSSSNNCLCCEKCMRDSFALFSAFTGFS